MNTRDLKRVIGNLTRQGKLSKHQATALHVALSKGASPKSVSSYLKFEVSDRATYSCRGPKGVAR